MPPPGPYFANVGSQPGSIGVLAAADALMPIGVAYEVGRTPGGLAVYRRPGRTQTPLRPGGGRGGGIPPGIAGGRGGVPRHRRR